MRNLHIFPHYFSVIRILDKLSTGCVLCNKLYNSFLSNIYFNTLKKIRKTNTIDLMAIGIADGCYISKIFVIFADNSEKKAISKTFLLMCSKDPFTLFPNRFHCISFSLSVFLLQKDSISEPQYEINFYKLRNNWKTASVFDHQKLTCSINV